MQNVPVRAQFKFNCIDIHPGRDLHGEILCHYSSDNVQADADFQEIAGKKIYSFIRTVSSGIVSAGSQQAKASTAADEMNEATAMRRCRWCYWGFHGMRKLKRN